MKEYTVRNRLKKQDTTSGMSRREALKFVAGAGAAVSIVPRHVLGGATVTAPSDKINMALIGAGNRGPADVGGAARRDDVEAVAVCDVDLDRAHRCAGRLGLDQKNIYQDYRPMLERKDIDAVIIASPDHWHAFHSIDAALAGKDVYVEKAMTLTVAGFQTP